MQKSETGAAWGNAEAGNRNMTAWKGKERKGTAYGQEIQATMEKLTQEQVKQMDEGNAARGAVVGGGKGLRVNVKKGAVGKKDKITDKNLR